MSYSIAIEKEPEYVFIKSIYIPRIFENITTEKIKHVFEVLDLGIISHIDLVPRGPSKLKMAFVHFKEWFTNPSAQNLARKILDPVTQAKLVYDDPWYWILLPNTKPIGFPREETIEGLKQIVHEYKLIIDDLEAQLFETWKQDIQEEKHADATINSTSPVHSTSSWEMSDFDDKPDKKDKENDTQSLASNLSSIIQQKIIGTNSNAHGFVARISNWNTEKQREFLGHVNFEHLHKPKVQDGFCDLEMGLTNEQSYSHAYTKIVPVHRSNQCEYDEVVSTTEEDACPSNTMFDSKGNKYVKKNGRWFRIEERKIEQHFWCDP
jgi:hypothetical protein